MTPPVLQVAASVANEHGLDLEVLVGTSHMSEAVRARHRWRALIARTLGYGHPSGITLSELARLLECDRETVRVSLRFCAEDRP
jgi:hypothetical protein